MSTREELILREMNYCQHYSPRGGMSSVDQWCKAGVSLLSLKQSLQRQRSLHQESKDKFFLRPCIGGKQISNASLICKEWIPRTREMGEARADELEVFLKHQEATGLLIMSWRDSLGCDKQEAVECPVCKGRLHLSQSGHNGHVHATCETENCVSWVE